MILLWVNSKDGLPAYQIRANLFKWEIPVREREGESLHPAVEKRWTSEA